ncbi:hypothetical protein EDD15DRAFT_2200764 [Pisolithus albus]|nr:hypothetical protein EDD15DRAFT_2200764 [Pisolithus albus]
MSFCQTLSHGVWVCRNLLLSPKVVNIVRIPPTIIHRLDTSYSPGSYIMALVAGRAEVGNAATPNVGDKDKPRVKEHTCWTPMVCHFLGSDGSPCLEQITCATVPEHLESHGVKHTTSSVMFARNTLHTRGDRLPATLAKIPDNTVLLMRKLTMRGLKTISAWGTLLAVYHARHSLNALCGLSWGQGDVPRAADYLPVAWLFLSVISGKNTLDTQGDRLSASLRKLVDNTLQDKCALYGEAAKYSLILHDAIPRAGLPKFWAMASDLRIIEFTECATRVIVTRTRMTNSVNDCTETVAAGRLPLITFMEALPSENYNTKVGPSSPLKPLMFMESGVTVTSTLSSPTLAHDTTGGIHLDQMWITNRRRPRRTPENKGADAIALAVAGLLREARQDSWRHFVRHTREMHLEHVKEVQVKARGQRCQLRDFYTAVLGNGSVEADFITIDQTREVPAAAAETLLAPQVMLAEAKANKA